jgi:hypothetical protein
MSAGTTLSWRARRGIKRCLPKWRRCGCAWPKFAEGVGVTVPMMPTRAVGRIGRRPRSVHARFTAPASPIRRRRCSRAARLRIATGRVASHRWERRPAGDATREQVRWRRQHRGRPRDLSAAGHISEACGRPHRQHRRCPLHRPRSPMPRCRGRCCPDRSDRG